MNEEHKRKIGLANSIALKGRKLSEEHRKKLSLAKMGDKNPSKREDVRKKIGEAMKGKKKSPEHAAKARMASLGRKQTVEERRKKSEALKGEKSHLWRGGIDKLHKTERNLIVYSLEYRLWREAVFQRDNWTCRFCGIRGKRLHADHIKPFCDYPELRLALDNGRTLCIDCHRKTDTYGRPSSKYKLTN